MKRKVLMVVLYTIVMLVSAAVLPMRVVDYINQPERVVYLSTLMLTVAIPSGLAILTLLWGGFKVRAFKPVSRRSFSTTLPRV